MNQHRKDISATVAYMVGIKETTLEMHYDKEKLDALKLNKNATIIRYLNQIRTTLFLKFKATDEQMRYHLKNLNSIEWYDAESIKQLEAWGIPVIQVNYTSHKYVEDINILIKREIENCRNLFDEWINFDYIKDLFVIPVNKKDIQKKEFTKFIRNLNSYPFQMYVHWEPEERGNILLDDRLFLSVLYKLHG